MRNKRWLSRLAAGLGLALTSLTGCQTWMGGMTLPSPWYPQPPNTEGNPLFVNKNVIEALALLLLACYPTGRWLGLDALLSRVCCGRKAAPAMTAA